MGETIDSNPRFLILGSQGLIGESLVSEIADQHSWAGTYHRRPSSGLLPLDITDSSEVRELFLKYKSEYTILSSNLKGGVVFCEGHPQLAKAFHYDAVKVLGEQCKRNNSKLVYLSTECVFDGEKEQYSEGDQVNPLNIYGLYKAKSEQWIQENLNNYLIIRTCFVYGWQPATQTPNALMSTYFKIAKNQQCPVPTYRYGSPTYVYDLAKAIIELCLNNSTGLFHVCGAGFTDRYHWLKKTGDYLGWDTSLILPQAEPRKEDVKYPVRVQLDCSKFLERYKTKMNSFEEALVMLKEDAQKHPMETIS